MRFIVSPNPFLFVSVHVDGHQVLNPETFLDFYIPPTSNHTMLARATPSLFLDFSFSISYVLKYIIYFSNGMHLAYMDLDNFLGGFRQMPTVRWWYLLSLSFKFHEVFRSLECRDLRLHLHILTSYWDRLRFQQPVCVLVCCWWLGTV